MTEPVLILTMKWGTLYPASDVNVLAAAVRRHLRRPHRFICFTDDAAGLAPGIEPLPLPELALPPGSGDTRWRKLALFNRDLAGLSGTALFLDLDLIVTGGMDAFFDYRPDEADQVVILRDDDLFRPKPLRRLNPARDRFLHMVGNTSVFRYRVGAHPGIVDAYLADMAGAAARYEHEQQLVSDHLDRQGKLSYWPRGWCVSFKNDCLGRHGTSWLRPSRCPEDARIVVFAGSPKLDEVLAGRGNRWHRRIGDVGWIRDARSLPE